MYQTLHHIHKLQNDCDTFNACVTHDIRQVELLLTFDVTPPTFTTASESSLHMEKHPTVTSNPSHSGDRRPTKRRKVYIVQCAHEAQIAHSYGVLSTGTGTHIGEISFYGLTLKHTKTL
uniref:AlNc14C254G9686 protein n=1 Tax=Albugo laibachii Nc14 TaxID=890382 RepID=F0WTK7_9STRA|nr:AlNc14C254G9686 [Albugo laibachii Nc14]|eukprot:CCA24698.1 AlNc14C254G9686 [Albugo laibachii Nc14]